MSRQFLTPEQVKAKCPVAFYTEPTAQVSDKYTFANTSVVMDDLSNLGWLPVQAAMRKSRIAKYSKHMVVFQNPEIAVAGKGGDDVFPQIILNNSHDGTSSFQFRIGLYRLVCSNGLVVATSEFQSLKIRHMHYSFDALRDVVKTSVDTLPRHIEILNEMQEVELTQMQQNDLALQALLIRHRVPENEGKAMFPISTLESLLKAWRFQDQGNDLWRTFNRVQENVLQGNYTYRNGEKERKASRIKSFLADQEINQGLFEKATQLIPA